jgi:Domain of unknown function (DUF4116)
MKAGIKLMSDTRPRLEKIHVLHGRALSEAVGQREPTSSEAYLSTKDLILRFAGADPTDGKSRTQWLVKTYIQDDQFKLEDLGRVDAALAAFERFKRRLPVEQRELSRFKSLRELETFVDPFVKAEERARLTRDLSTATGREKRRLEEWKARDESIIVQEEEGLPTIAVPMTEFAAQWWGRGTKWCTSAEKNNAFNDYHKDAPLVIIVCPDGAKFQMYVQSDTFQFMDNTDTKVGEKTVSERWNEFQPLIYWAIEQDGQTLGYVPKKYRNPELCRIAVQQNGTALEYILEDKKTPELCKIAVEQNGLALYYVPKEQRTSELYYLAVQQNGLALDFVPENKRTSKLCRLAVQQNGMALKYVPEEHITSDLYQLAVQQNWRALQLVPEDYRTPELCRLAVEQDGEVLRYVPEKHKTPELCRIAVEQSGTALYNVPEKYGNPKFWRKFLVWFDKRYIDEQDPLELCRLAVQQNGMALESIPKNKRTLEIYRLAVQQNGWALQSVPEDKKIKELCRLAVQQNGEVLRYVPEKHKTPELCRIAVEQSGTALYNVPEKHRTSELCRIAVEQDGMALEHVPEKHRTSELLACILPVQPTWHPDILQGLYSHSQSFRIPSQL